MTNPFSGAYGLDIGDLSIKLVQLTPRRRLSFQPSFELKRYYSVKEIRQTKLQPGCIVNGEIQRQDAVMKKLLYILGKEGPLKKIDVPWVVAGLPEPKSFLKLIELDFPPEELPSEDVAYHIKNHLPFELTEAYLDWQVVTIAGGPPNKTQILAAAMPKSVSDAYSDLLESAGLIPLALETESISLCRSLVTAAKDYTGQARAILDLGATRSSLIIYDYNTIQFTNKLNFSGEMLTTAIGLELKLEHASAEELKLRNGINYDANYPGYLKPIAQLTDNLIQEIKTNLAFYKAHFTNANPVTHITMSGGTANLRNMGDVISKQLAIETAPGHAWKNLNNNNIGEKENEFGLTFASAIGMAIRAAQFQI